MGVSVVSIHCVGLNCVNVLSYGLKQREVVHSEAAPVETGVAVDLTRRGFVSASVVDQSRL